VAPCVSGSNFSRAGQVQRGKGGKQGVGGLLESIERAGGKQRAGGEFGLGGGTVAGWLGAHQLQSCTACDSHKL